LLDGIEASLQFAGGNFLAPAASSSSSSSQPQALVPETAAGNCSASAPSTDNENHEILESIKIDNLDKFARIALESLHLGAIFDKHCNQKKAALSRVPPETSTCLKVCAAMYEKFFPERKVCWTNSEIALDILKRAELICGEFHPDDTLRLLYIGGDSTLVMHEYNAHMLNKGHQDPEGRGMHFKQQWDANHIIHCKKVGATTVALVSSSKIADQVEIFQALLDEWKKTCAEMDADAGGNSSAALAKCGNIV
jgi:hypothetical protein